MHIFEIKQGEFTLAAVVMFWKCLNRKFSLFRFTTGSHKSTMIQTIYQQKCQRTWNNILVLNKVVDPKMYKLNLFTKSKCVTKSCIFHFRLRSFGYHVKVKIQLMLRILVLFNIYHEEDSLAISIPSQTKMVIYHL